ncbi:hypothetical protein HN512_02880 [Candidatus Peregrinibacteria bacterium]|jgi:hypothetical protein|nr:hypothetical protein [Candidatus Peregrinibacteria bacterium]MBT3598757.1 hypothetical protein [Candidatus Peregrinibacteria bacterium]MBT4367575.1 hypothetical protein [Candidatus Peregrinibacteria bacterium]MBT4585825.1 hypothetical protein [Candidatus Peregrinibacteria bacterium]MBT6731233.1 hypothetical protein [Candidatus Peregrinibacteria bacterium]
MSTTSIIIIGVIVYLFLFELILSLKFIKITEDNLPPPFNVQHKAWMKFSHILGIIMSKIILSILWIVGFGLYAIIWRLCHLKKKKKDSYWVEISKEGNSMKYSF